MTKLVQAKREGRKAAERRIKQVEREDRSYWEYRLRPAPSSH